VLSALNRGFWRKASLTLGLFAAVCFTLPPAVLAMGHGANTMHCLSHADRVDHGAAKTVHADHGAKHGVVLIKHQGDHAPSGDHRTMTCCGLYCVSAVSPDDGRIAERLPEGVPQTTALSPRLISRAAPRPEHPPKPRLFV
jgi:hypothetical protein